MSTRQHLTLNELRVFMVEDEALISMLLEDHLSEMGCRIAASAAHYEEACSKAASAQFDVAILDLNLDGISTLPIADLLDRRGKPFAFATGYSASDAMEKYPNAPVLRKPFGRADVEKALLAATEMTGRDSRHGSPPV